MNITILTYGSRGDVQPFLALALGLQAAGHTVRLAAPYRFENLVSAFGIPFVPLAGDPEIISQALNEAGGNVYRMVRGMQEYVVKVAPEVLQGVQLAIRGAEFLVHSFLFTTGAHSFARQMEIPDASIQTFPMFAPTKAFPNVAMPNIRPGGLSCFSHWVATQIFWYGGNAGYNRLRRNSPAEFPEKLYWPFTPTQDRPLTPLVFAYSPSIMPRPADWTAPNIHIPGYFFLDEPDYQPAEGLQSFLAEGDPPLCITFGSNINQQTEHVLKAALATLERTGQRAIFLTGWGRWQPEKPPAGALFHESAPHGWLFPRCKAIVHHGGAGTTAAGLRSGVPNIVVPHASDQPFWGKRVAAIGAGPQPIPISEFTADRFLAALAEIESEPIRAGAAEAGRRIREENGVVAAVALIEQHAKNYS
jgi:sterol 3beta-glucosyltransferase